MVHTVQRGIVGNCECAHSQFSMVTNLAKLYLSGCLITGFLILFLVMSGIALKKKFVSLTCLNLRGNILMSACEQIC